MIMTRMSQPSPAATTATGALRLADWGLLRATGPDARAFLHGQLTQDVEGLAPGQARLAGWCSAKGRLLASFVIWRDGEHDVLLACSADVLPGVLKRLSMFVLRAKCKLSDASAERPLWGLAGATAAAALGDAALAPVGSVQVLGDAHLVRLPDSALLGQPVPRWLWASAGAAVPELPTLDASTWLGLEAASGVARIVAATAEQFVPQMVNLEQVGGVHFQKGCYPGQEVVARSQFRGTLKRRAQFVSAPAALQPGQEVFSSADPGQPAGMVVNAGSLPGTGHVALVELKLAALEGGTLHAGMADGPLLTPAALPYVVRDDIV
jgi:tRNA-modifying protein YgfZ